MCTMGCLPARDVKIGDKIHHRRTAASSGVFTVQSIVPIYGGKLQFRCTGVSELGTPIKPSVAYGVNEEVEIVR